MKKLLFYLTVFVAVAGLMVMSCQKSQNSVEPLSEQSELSALEKKGDIKGIKVDHQLQENTFLTNSVVVHAAAGVVTTGMSSLSHNNFATDKKFCEYFVTEELSDGCVSVGAEQGKIICLPCPGTGDEDCPFLTRITIKSENCKKILCKVTVRRFDLNCKKKCSGKSFSLCQ